MRIASTESPAEMQINIVCRSAAADHCHGIRISPHGTFEICPNISCRAHRHGGQSVMISVQHDFESLIETEHIRDAVFQLALAHRSPGISDRVIVQLCFLSRNVHLFEKLAQTHVCQKITAPIFKSLSDRCSHHFPACHTEDLAVYMGTQRTLIERVNSSEERKLKSQVMNVPHKTQAL